MKIVFVTGQFSPFQLELASAINKDCGVEYIVLFANSNSSRPAYWDNIHQALFEFSRSFEEGKGASQKDWVVSKLEEFDPDIIICGGIRGALRTACIRYKGNVKRRVHFGLWLEPPNLRKNKLVSLIRSLEYAVRLRGVDFVFAIGEDAKKQYGRWQKNTFLLQYGQDLSGLLERPLLGLYDGELKILFSGGLQPRHNLDMVLEALKRLLSTHGPVFTFTISGYGPVEEDIRRFLDENPRLSELVYFDRDFDCWADRLNPFLYSNVFLYPTEYAGWGLVIPEAMAAGHVVISSHGAHAARHYIKDHVSGLIIRNSVDEIYHSLVELVAEPELRYRLGQYARNIAMEGDALSVGSRLAEISHSIVQEHTTV